MGFESWGPGQSAVAVLALLGATFSGFGCGRAEQSNSAGHHGGAGAAGSTSSGGRAGGGGSSPSAGVAGVLAASGGSTFVAAPEEQPVRVARHFAVGEETKRGCFTSGVATDGKLIVAGTLQASPFWTELGSDRREQSVAPTLLGVDGSSLVFGDAESQWLAWSEPQKDALHIEPLGASAAGQVFSLRGRPLAGFGSATDYALLLTDGNALTLLRSSAGASSVVPVELAGCVDVSSVAMGTFMGDTVLAYFCKPSANDRGLLLTSRVGAGSVTAERTAIELDVPGTPATYWTGEEFVVVHATASGGTALSRVTPGSTKLSSVVVDEAAEAADATYALTRTGSSYVFTRSTCQGHEDAASTGRFDLCRVGSDENPASCVSFDAPCTRANLVSTGDEAWLLPCNDVTAPALLELDASAPKVLPDVLFPLGSSLLRPTALSCDGDDCQALLSVDALRASTSQDERLLFAHSALEAKCEQELCSGAEFQLTNVLAARNPDAAFWLPPLAERQASGLPLGVMVGVRTETRIVARLALLAPDGLRWEQDAPLLGGDSVFFARDSGFDIFQSSYLDGGDSLFRSRVDAALASAAEPLPSLRAGRGVPKMARCRERLFILGLAQSEASSIDPPEPAIFELDPASAAVHELFNPGLPKTSDSGAARWLGCAGDWLFVLDGLRVSRYSLSGERLPDVLLSLPNGRGEPELFTSFDTLSDKVWWSRVSPGDDALHALLFSAAGSVLAFSLPLAEGAAPVTGLELAPDEGDGWLRALYRSKAGRVFVSAWKLEG